MTAMPRDYDSDPGRFLASTELPGDDIHPFVAARLADTGARTVLDVGGGSGRLARLLPDLSMRCLLIDLSPAMLARAPRPAARADASRLPVTDASVDAVTALYMLYHFDEPRDPIAEARRVLRPGGLFVACAPNRDSSPERARPARLGQLFSIRRRGCSRCCRVRVQCAWRRRRGREMGRTTGHPVIRPPGWRVPAHTRHERGCRTSDRRSIGLAACPDNARLLRIRPQGT